MDGAGDAEVAEPAAAEGELLELTNAVIKQLKCLLAQH